MKELCPPGMPEDPVSAASRLSLPSQKVGPGPPNTLISITQDHTVLNPVRMGLWLILYKSQIGSGGLLEDSPEPRASA